MPTPGAGSLHDGDDSSNRILTPAQIRLDALISAKESELSATSTTKFAEVDRAFEDWAGVKPAYTSAVSKAGNLTVRFVQSGRAGQAVIKIAIIPGGDVERYVRAGQTWIERDLRARAFVFCAKMAGKWDVVAIHDRSGGAIAGRLARADMFPKARVTQAARPKELLSEEELTQLAKELHLDRSWLEDVVWMLNDKRSIVLYGP